MPKASTRPTPVAEYTYGNLVRAVKARVAAEAGGETRAVRLTGGVRRWRLRVETHGADVVRLCRLAARVNCPLTVYAWSETEVRYVLELNNRAAAILLQDPTDA